MLYLEFWKSKQGIRFFDIQRLVFFDPLEQWLGCKSIPQKQKIIWVIWLVSVKKHSENLISMKKSNHPQSYIVAVGVSTYLSMALSVSLWTYLSRSE